MEKIVIRRPRAPGEFRYTEDIQKNAWGASDIDVTPTHVCVATHLAGGCVYIAFCNDKPVGFVLGLVGLRNGKVFMHSHQLGCFQIF